LSAVQASRSVAQSFDALIFIKIIARSISKLQHLCVIAAWSLSFNRMGICNVDPPYHSVARMGDHADGDVFEPDAAVRQRLQQPSLDRLSGRFDRNHHVAPV